MRMPSAAKPPAAVGQVDEDGPIADGTFVAVSVFVVANELDDAVEAAFANRPGLVDSAPGFRSMEVLRGLDRREEFWLVTRWDDEASYVTWHKSHGYVASHAGIPKGLRLVPKAAYVRRMREIAR